MSHNFMMAMFCAAFLGLVAALALPSTKQKEVQPIKVEAITDPSTGCKYLTALNVGITPQLDKDGKIICN